VQAHTDSAASESARAIDAEAYATGDHVAFAGPPSLHTAAHEAAHVVQQRAGVHLKGGVGEERDAYEQQADAVADRVVRGERAEDLLPRTDGGGGRSAVQLETAAPKDIGAKIKGFKNSTSVWMAWRPQELKDCDPALKEIGEDLAKGEIDLKQAGRMLLPVLNAVDDYMSGSSFGDEDKEARKRKYAAWRSELLELLDRETIAGWAQTAIARSTVKPDAKYTPSRFMHGHRIADSQEGGVNMGYEDSSALSRLKGGDYVEINAAFRAGDHGKLDGLLKGAQAIDNYRRRGGALVPTAGRVKRVSNTLLGGITEKVKVGDEHQEAGFAFFGSNASSISGDKTFTIFAQLKKAMAYKSTMYGEAEADWEYVTLPGAKFKVTGIEKNTYYYEEL
jgi:hypothetical protein